MARHATGVNHDPEVTALVGEWQNPDSARPWMAPGRGAHYDLAASTIASKHDQRGHHMSGNRFPEGFEVCLMLL